MMQQQPQQMMPEEMPEDDMAMDPNAEPATPEEEAQLEEAFLLAQEMLYGQGEAGDQVAKLVQQSQDITEGIGKATATIVIAVEKRAGGLQDAVKLELSQLVIAELAGMAVEFGALAEDEVDDSFIDAVVSHAYSEYLTMKEAMGELDPAELESSVAEAEQEMGVSTRNQQQAQPQQPQQAPQQGAGLLGI